MQRFPGGRLILRCNFKKKKWLMARPTSDRREPQLSLVFKLVVQGFTGSLGLTNRPKKNQGIDKKRV